MASRTVAVTAAMAAVVVLALSATGCSLIFVERVKPRMSRDETVSCTTSPAAYILDGMIAGYQVYRTVNALSNKESDYRGSPLSRDADVVAGIALTSLFTVSAGLGVGWVGECRDAAGLNDDERQANAEAEAEARREAREAARARATAQMAARAAAASSRAAAPASAASRPPPPPPPGSAPPSP